MKFITVNGVVLSDYLISCKDGVAQIWSAKGEELTPMVMPTSGKSDYPKKGFMINGKLKFIGIQGNSDGSMTVFDITPGV